MPLEVNLKPIKHISLNVHKIHSQSGCGLLSHQNIFQTFRTGYVGSASNRAVHLRIWKFPISNATIHTAHWTAGHIELWTHPSETTPMNVDITKREPTMKSTATTASSKEKGSQTSQKSKSTTAQLHSFHFCETTTHTSRDTISYIQTAPHK